MRVPGGRVGRLLSCGKRDARFRSSVCGGGASQVSVGGREVTMPSEKVVEGEWMPCTAILKHSGKVLCSA